MRRLTLCCVLASFAALTPSSARAQQKAGPDSAANPLTAGQYGLYSLIKGYIIKAADEMPEASYSFQPTHAVRTYGQLVGHLADANYMFCSTAKGEANPNTVKIEKTVTKKADLIKALSAAFAYCDGVYSDMKDGQLGDRVDLFGMHLARLTVLSFNSAHDNEHYGNIVTYLRMKGLVPPSSQQQAPAT